MEIAHQREQIRSSPSNKQFQTVNLEEFRNKEVGSGYQARGVMRQNTGLSSSMNIIDMTKKAEREESDGNSDDSSDRSRERRKSKKRNKSKRRKVGSHKEDLVEKYLQSTELRQFRNELEKIISEASR